MVVKNELTREQVSLRIGCSIGTVMKFEREKKLNPRREKVAGSMRERVWFNPEEVEKIAREYKPTRQQRVKVDTRLVEANVRGKVAAKLYPMFKANITDFTELCAATEADPLLIAELYEAWLLGPAGIVKRKVAEREQEKREALAAEERRRNYDKLRRREWLEAQTEIARITGKPTLGRTSGPPKNDIVTKTVDKEKKTG